MHPSLQVLIISDYPSVEWYCVYAILCLTLISFPRQTSAQNEYTRAEGIQHYLQLTLNCFTTKKTDLFFLQLQQVFFTLTIIKYSLAKQLKLKVS